MCEGDVIGDPVTLAYVLYPYKTKGMCKSANEKGHIHCVVFLINITPRRYVKKSQKNNPRRSTFFLTSI